VYATLQDISTNGQQQSCVSSVAMLKKNAASSS